ncbi:DUF72 domain-containing protein [Asticcacaulis sp. AND118]|uniref:DUF72 domain-containing protein n=1 Tax=Asticcacaulis sp. AND118 TaxID=2840468 RepID=UPI001CFFCF52|nr:DUF72 domain-containing protein [Asticcacaulis sp. AND118]UDF04671.1 DUF72 domain-containing protein [Asticcacaulis sp. AND118]
MSIYIGIGGWNFEPWRGTFYPADVSQKKELEYASRKLTSIEINSTYYGSQKPETFAKWRDDTPDGFVFCVKGSRYTTNRRVLAEAGDSIEKFIGSGVTELKDKLGPINWQFMATKKFDPQDFEAFLKLLPASHDGVTLRHAIEVRSPTFQTPEFIDMARHYKVAVVNAFDEDFPQIGDQTTDFAYLRLLGTEENEPIGYSEAALDEWSGRLKAIETGVVPEDIACVGERNRHESDGKSRDVFAYVISGDKVKNPHAAMALIERLK